MHILRQRQMIERYQHIANLHQALFEAECRMRVAVNAARELDDTVYLDMVEWLHGKISVALERIAVDSDEALSALGASFG